MPDEVQGPQQSALPLSQAYAEAQDRDVILYNGPLERGHDRELLDQCCNRSRRRRNVLLILVTRGGNADAAYRVARCLQRSYENISVYVTGMCKSAGTLVAIASNELIVADAGELGPLDVQMSKKDELWETQSGLTVASALSSLHEKAFSAFNHFFLETKYRRMTTRTASSVAARLTCGLFAPIYSQIDPMHVGESARSTAISLRYGLRLLAISHNLSEEGLKDLISGYPSHGFVIDREEAERLFNSVRPPTEDESMISAALGDLAVEQVGREPVITYLSEEPAPVEEAPKPSAATNATTGVGEGAHDSKQNTTFDSTRGAATASDRPENAAREGTSELGTDPPVLAGSYGKGDRGAARSDV